MPLPGGQQEAAERVLETVYTYKLKNARVPLSDMFRDLPDRTAWPAYYKFIPEPRALSNIKDKLEKGKYKTADDLHSDIGLVFANAMHFNEAASGIHQDAKKLDVRSLLYTQRTTKTYQQLYNLQILFRKEWEAAVAAGTLPQIKEEEEKEQPVVEPPARQSTSRSSRTRDIAPPPPTPAAGIRLAKKGASSTPSVSRNATLTPAPQRIATPQYQQTVPQQAIAPQPNLVPIAPAISTALRPIQPIIAPVARTPVPVPAPAPVPVQAQVQVQAATPVPVPAEADEDGTAGLVRDKQGDELVQQLEATFPKCPGPSEEGWMQLPEGVDPVEKYTAILSEIKEFKDSGDRAGDILECLPDETTNKVLSFNVRGSIHEWPTVTDTPTQKTPLSVSLIENKIRTRAYSSPKEFDIDMARLFEKARKWHEEGTYSYGRVLVLQRLTCPKQEDMQVDVTSSNPPVTETSSSVTFKGVVYSAGDWVHLANKETPSKPIVAQVQKIEGSGLQTVHNATRSFWEREVFKTGYTTSNPLQEIIEPVACQFFPKHIRGRPSPPAWYPGRPLYVCESRYDASSKSFSKIKNWSSCIPDGVRKSTTEDYMPIKPFSSSKPVVPKKLPSPFLKGVTLFKKRGGGGGNLASGPQKDRSIVTAAGGLAVVQASTVDVLPEETVKYFDRDPHTHQLLWFSGAPIETPRAHSRQPRHSLDYLYFLARQRERQHRGEDIDESRRKAAAVPPLSTELASLYREVFGSEGAGEHGDRRVVAEIDRGGDVEMNV
ncbi:hypothetical protein FRC09_000641 [Ceratobasidium sp. 395]|nr:hypothetical protein FRC09_000641 [Ceratobasidium sp. 395]